MATATICLSAFLAGLKATTLAEGETCTMPAVARIVHGDSQAGEG